MSENNEETKNTETKKENNSDEKAFVLGGNIELTGFKELVPGSMTIIKKIIGTYVKRYSELKPDFEKLKLTLKSIHQTTDVPKNFEIKARLLFRGGEADSEITERNLFSAIDSVLKKIEAEITK